MPAAFYDFFRKIKFLPNNVTIEADSTTDTAQIQAGSNIAFDVEDSTTSPGASTDKVIINGPQYDVYVPVTGLLPGEGANLRLERAALGTTGAITTDIEILSDPASPILVDRIDGNTIRISSSSPTIPFSQEQIEDFSAALLTGGTHTEITVNYDDLGPASSGNIDLAVTSTLQTITNRGATTTNAISITDATGSSNSTTGALKVTGGLGVFENINAGGNIATATGTITGSQLVSTVATGTAPLTVTSTTEVANLRAATASKWHNSRTVTFTGDVTGSFSIDGSADVSSVALTIGANTVELGTDTTGNYVATAGVSGNGLSGSSSTEGGTFTVTSNATSTNTGDTIVFRDTNGDFSARVITATTFSGNATTATQLQTARNINGVTFSGGGDIIVEPYVESDESTNATRYLTFVDSSTDGYQRLNEDSGLTYNPSTGTLTSTIFSGAVSATTVTASDTVTLNAGAIEEFSAQITGLTGAVTLDIKTNSVYFYTANATSNWTLNFRGDGSTTMDSYLAVGKSATVVLLATQGATAYYPTAFSVDGTAVTPKWLGGSAPTGGNASSVDAYSFTILKTAASTYTVIASQARYA